MSNLSLCSQCQAPTEPALLAEAQDYAFWQRPDGACPACLQQSLLQTLLKEGEDALHERIQSVWPLDAEAAFGALPTPLRLHADPRYTGRGTTIALVDSGFYPHPDLVQPNNRIRAWVDAGRQPVQAHYFTADETPRWPAWDGGHNWQWHGLMTSVVAAGNGYLSHGLYRGLASEAEVVLIQARDETGAISNETITRALHWLAEHGPAFGVRVVNLSVAGDVTHPLTSNPVDQAIAALIEMGMVVVAAAGNDGVRRLSPPATAPHALTIGGIDDHSLFDHAAITLWHSNYGQSSGGAGKPELVAPSIWVAAPLLPGTKVAQEAQQLFKGRRQGNPFYERRIAELKLITPHYQHVDGTSFAAPLVASAVACMLQANPQLTPLLVRHILSAIAEPVPGVPVERQGAGVLEAGQAVAVALHERHSHIPLSPLIEPAGVSFSLHDHAAQQVQVIGAWNNWRSPGLFASQVEPGVWQTAVQPIPPGRYPYKFLLDGAHWLDDPANPQKSPDGLGGLNAVLTVPA
jgi:serine protease AprX